MEDLSHTYHGKIGTKEGDDAENKIEAIGLKYHLLTDFTSFVAVDKSGRVIAPPTHSPVSQKTGEVCPMVAAPEQNQSRQNTNILMDATWAQCHFWDDHMEES